MTTGLPNWHAHSRFYSLAVEYYVSGRAALLCRNTLVTGNLFHHAVETLLKGQLSKSIALEKFKKVYYHNLPKVWKAFKGDFPTEDLTAFDAMINDLHKFEEIRYPEDKMLEDGAAITLGFGRGKVAASKPRGRNEPDYQMMVGDVDAFFARLFPLCGLNPKAYFSYLSPEGREVLATFNEEAGDWLP